jgi:hypothetical protein
MKVLVCGSRDWGDGDAIADRLADLAPDRPTILHGAASRKVRGVERSADALADRAARLYGYDVRPFPADWRAEPRRGGVLRNLRMLDERPDLVIAFQRGGSPGTQHTIDEARRRGIPVEVHVA